MFAGLWTMTGQPEGATEWTLEEKFAEAKGRGFSAMGGGTMPGIADLCEQFSMEFVAYIDGSQEAYKERLNAAAATKPARVNVQLCDHDTPPSEAVDVWIAMEQANAELGLHLNLDLEVHRDTATETPEKTWEIARLYREKTGQPIRLCFDYSHFAVVKHLHAPFSKRLLEYPDLIQLARQMHFRPFNGHHCQIPATDGKGNLTAGFENYMAFIEDLLKLWLDGSQDGATLYVCPENGPKMHTYGLPEFPNVWEDAVRIKDEVEALWNRLGG